MSFSRQFLASRALKIIPRATLCPNGVRPYLSRLQESQELQLAKIRTKHKAAIPCSERFLVTTTEDHAHLFPALLTNDICANSVHGAMNNSLSFQQTTFADTLGFRSPIYVRFRDVKSCMICQKDFTLLWTRNHCRACGMVCFAHMLQGLKAALHFPTSMLLSGGGGRARPVVLPSEDQIRLK